MSASEHRFPYRWQLADGFPAKGIKPNGRTVFGTFVCGGGSAMGYKLAGFDYLGGVEIDPKVAAVYADNLHPRHLYVEDIRDFNKRDDLPAADFCCPNAPQPNAPQPNASSYPSGSGAS